MSESTIGRLIVLNAEFHKVRERGITDWQDWANYNSIKHEIEDMANVAYERILQYAIKSV